MKKAIFVSGYLFYICSVVQAQEKLNDLTTPSSPASSVLGIQPGEVLSPKSYQALETAIYSSFMNSNMQVVVPNDFALEFTPYWTGNHCLTLEEYLYPKSMGAQVVRNSSFSLASTQNFLLGDSTATNGIALGYRTTLYFANRRDRENIETYRKKIKTNHIIESRIGAQAEKLAIQAGIKTKKDFLDTLRPHLLKVISAIDGNKNNAEEFTEAVYKAAETLPAFDKNNPDPLLDKLYVIIDSIIQKDSVFNKFEDFIRNRQGLYVDLAYGSMLNFPTNDFEFSFVPRQALWITPTYRFKDELNILKIMGVFRYEWHSMDYYKKYFPASKFYQNNTDAGLAISGEFKKFSIQFEGISRVSQSEVPAGTDVNGNQLYTKEKSSDIQYMGTFSYRLNDQFVLTYTLGKQFDPVLNPDNTLISKFSLNFGFGGPDKDDVK